MRMDRNTCPYTRRFVRDILVDGEPMPRGSVLTADEERGFVEKLILIGPVEAGKPLPCRTSAHGLPLVECVVGKVEIVLRGGPEAVRLIRAAA